MYAKLFASLYQGTLRGRAYEILVFTNMLATADCFGYVDKHPRAIADEVGLTVEEVQEAIKVLMAPDPSSRSPEEEGRRIVLLDEHRDWGWKIVNYSKYRSIRNEDDRRVQNRLAQQRYRDRHKQASASVSHGNTSSAQAEAEAEAEADAKAGKAKPKRAARAEGIANLPDWLNLEDWEAYKQHRGAKYTARAQAMALTKLEEWMREGQDPNAILRQSVMQGWKGLFELKERNSGRNYHQNTERLIGPSGGRVIEMDQD